MKKLSFMVVFAVLLLPDVAVAGLPTALVAPAPIFRRASEGLFVSVARADDRLVTVGEQGRILVSDDNGFFWHQVPVPTDVTLTGVTFATPQDGWAIGQMGVILRTQDGGKSWKRVFDGKQANNALQKMAMADLKVQPDNQRAKANLAAAEQFVAGGITVPFLGIDALSAKNIVVVGGFGMAFESNNGGADWFPIFDAIPNPNGLNIYAVITSGRQIYYIGEQGFLVRQSTDGSYIALTVPTNGTLFGGVAVGDADLVLYGLQGTVLRSTDAGMHWQVITTGVTAGIDAGVVLVDRRIVLGDNTGDLLVSSDGGKHFTIVDNAGEPVAGIAQASNGNIIVVGPVGIKVIPLAHIHSGA